jgi:hypothetical protein
LVLYIQKKGEIFGVSPSDSHDWDSAYLVPP